MFNAILLNKNDDDGTADARLTPPAGAQLPAETLTKAAGIVAGRVRGRLVVDVNA